MGSRTNRTVSTRSRPGHLIIGRIRTRRRVFQNGGIPPRLFDSLCRTVPVLFQFSVVQAAGLVLSFVDGRDAAIGGRGTVEFEIRITSHLKMLEQARQ